MRVLVERQSVCIGDDCTAPNGQFIIFESGTSLSTLLLRIGQYVPNYSGRQHTIWGIEYKEKPIAFIECDEHSGYKYMLNIDDILADTLNEEKIYCRYFYDYNGSLSSNISNILCLVGEQKEYALLDYVKAYYELPKDKRWGW